jgi:hypothetical protein
MADIDINAEMEKIFQAESGGEQKYTQAERNDVIFLVMSVIALDGDVKVPSDMEIAVFADVFGRAVGKIDVLRPDLKGDKAALATMLTDPAGQQSLVSTYFSVFPPRADLWRAVERLVSKVQGVPSGEAPQISAAALAAVGASRVNRAPMMNAKRPEGTVDVSKLAPRRRV